MGSGFLSIKNDFGLEFHFPGRQFDRYNVPSLFTGGNIEEYFQIPDFNGRPTGWAVLLEDQLDFIAAGFRCLQQPETLGIP